jgi:hypothetical protein
VEIGEELENAMSREEGLRGAALPTVAPGEESNQLNLTSCAKERQQLTTLSEYCTTGHYKCGRE